MLPMLRDNCDTVTLTKPTKLKKYDVVFFYHKPTNSYVLHRIIKVNNDGTYNICGDNRMVCEVNVPKKDIFAVVTTFTRTMLLIKSLTLIIRFIPENVLQRRN